MLLRGNGGRDLGNDDDGDGDDDDDHGDDARKQRGLKKQCPSHHMIIDHRGGNSCK